MLNLVNVVVRWKCYHHIMCRQDFVGIWDQKKNHLPVEYANWYVSFLKIVKLELSFVNELKVNYKFVLFN